MGTTFGLSMVMLVTILTIQGEVTLVVQKKISPIFKHEHQCIESKNNKENLENVVCGKENQSHSSSIGSILEVKDALSRKETPVDKTYS